MILDRQGRLFGRINLLDLMAFCLLMSLGGTVWYVIRVSQYQSLEVFSAEPKRAVVGSGTRVMMKGTGFDSETTIRLGDYPDQGGVYLDESTIGIEITEKFNPDIYRVIVRDGRGRYTVLPDPVEVVWIPRISEVRPKPIYSAGAGARIEILGEFFTDPCSVWVGERELEVVAVTDHHHIEAQLKKGDVPLPQGEQAVTVVNRGNHRATLKDAVTVWPPPEVHSIEPSTLVVGQTVEMVLHGKCLRESTRVWFGKHFLGEARYVDPEHLRIQVTGRPEIGGQDLFLELPDGPKVFALERALEIQSRVPVLMVVDLFLDDDKSVALLELLRQLPAWQQRRPIPNLNLQRAVHHYFSRTLPVVEVVLPAEMAKGAGGYRYQYGDEPLRIGHRITVTVNGQRVSGTVVAEPFAVFADDLLNDMKN